MKESELGKQDTNGFLFFRFRFTLLRFFAFHRFSPFDTLMVDGKLIQFQTLLLSSEPKHKEAIQKYMVRKLDIPVEKLESDVFISNKP